MTGKPDAVHMIHIHAPIAKVWNALTDPAASPGYFFGHRWEFGPLGGDFRVVRPDGSLDSEGRVLVRDEPRLLRVTWRVVSIEALKDAAPGEVEFRLDDFGDVVRLTVSEFGRPPEMAAFTEAARQGWSLILSGLKTLLETGSPMPAVKPEPSK